MHRYSNIFFKKNSKLRKTCLRKKILNKNFLLSNNEIIQLGNMNEERLYEFLVKKKRNMEAFLFKKENIDGHDFIIFFSEEEGEEILKQIGLNKKQILTMKILYYFIYRFRLFFLTDLKNNEIPYYI